MYHTTSEWGMGNGKIILRSLCITNYQLPITKKPLALALFEFCLRHAALSERLMPVEGAKSQIKVKVR
jgi:hypothetical protein